MQKRFVLLIGGCALSLALVENPVGAQLVRLPHTPAINETAFQGSNDGLVPVPQGSTAQLGGTGSITTGQPFDPYASNSGAAASPPSLLGAPSATVPSGSTTPFWQASPGCPPGQPNCGTGAAGFPQQPPVVFPGGVNFGGATTNWPQPQAGPYLRFCQDLRVRHTWLAGKPRPDQMDINDVEIATTINFPNFLWSGQPLQVSPVFIFHFWAHPVTDSVQFATELPSRAYSAYGTLRWQPMFTPSLGADLEVSGGAFSDFSSVTRDTLRLFGTGVAVLALTPTLTLKAGATYLDRLNIKLLPAGGVLWTPNPQTRFDFFFPKPKLAQFLTTIGNTDIWWYVHGEYGGGSWAVERSLLVGNAFVPNTGDPRLDINDIRVGLGLEWTGPRGGRGFFESAYVLDREIVFASGPPLSVSLDDTVMVRAGISF